MFEPSPPSSAAEHPESDRPAPLKELIQLYQTEHALLLKRQQEVERRRAAVRAAAVQEASEIILSARQEIRRVLVQTRRELVELAAQLRAVGYEPASDGSIGGDDFQVSVARDVRNVLRDARSDLSDLARDAGDLYPGGTGTRLLTPPTVEMASLPEPHASHDVSSDSTEGPSGSAADDSSEQVPASGPSRAVRRALAGGNRARGCRSRRHGDRLGALFAPKRSRASRTRTWGSGGRRQGSRTRPERLHGVDRRF